ncbi:MAG TPA: helix-turn-helix transcriptional regulator [Solirubrobacterales bacterium]|nr:helix-turn-helix transcriptional regulator [Solirubrobacterales bacterium]
MRIENENSDQAVLEELGARLARTRLEQNVSQEKLASAAGVSKSTLERIETGREVKLTSLVRILRALGRLELLDQLVPAPLPSPIERARLQGRQRQRAAEPRRKEEAEQPGLWRWAGEEDEGA